MANLSDNPELQQAASGTILGNERLQETEPCTCEHCQKLPAELKGYDFSCGRCRSGRLWVRYLHDRGAIQLECSDCGGPMCTVKVGSMAS